VPCAVGPCIGRESHFTNKTETLSVPTSAYNYPYLQSRPICPLGQQLEMPHLPSFYAWRFRTNKPYFGSLLLRLNCTYITKNIASEVELFWKYWREKNVVFLRFLVLYLFSVKRDALQVHWFGLESTPTPSHVAGRVLCKVLRTLRMIFMKILRNFLLNIFMSLRCYQRLS
jgi:hypothetical protein